ncbi:MFS transporter [Microbacterium kribbense]|uniref:MFS transporter n=1 Tax=Microbacterium kribbense TaxID=433645 RepID=A0ABP7G3Y8_9MICO
MTPAAAAPGGQAPAWSGHARGSRAYRRLLVALFCAGIATFAQLYSPQATLPEIAAQLRVDAASSALTVSAATLGLAVGVIPWSSVADRLGRVRAMSIALIGATLFGFLVPFTPNFTALLAGRFFEGLMIAGVPAVAIAYLSEEVDVRSAARAAGTYVAGTTIGGLSGRLIAGPLAEIAGWRVGVLAVVVVCAAATVAFMLLAPIPRGFTPHGRRSPGRTLAQLCVNLRSRRQLALYLQALALMGGFVALYNYLTFRLASAPFGLPPGVVALIFLAYLAGTWSSAQAGALASRFGRLPVLIASTLVMAAGVAITLVDVLVVVIAGLVVATAGFFGAHAVASGWTGADAATGRAQAASLYNLFYYTGSSVFGWLGGVFLAGAGWPGVVLMVEVLVVAALGVASLVLRPGL